MLASSEVLVVVPALNERERIAAVIETMPSWVDHIVVIDDGSDDGTSERAKGTRAIVLSHEKRRGVGAAIATGYRYGLEQTRADVFAVMAGDGQMHPSDLENVVAQIARGDFGYVKGNRFGNGPMPLFRRRGGDVLSLLTSLAVGRSFTDTQCGFTAIKRSVCAAIDLDSMWPSYGYPNDLLGTLVGLGVDIAEVPVRPIYDGQASKLRFWHAPHFAFTIARAAFRARASFAVGRLAAREKAY